MTLKEIKKLAEDRGIRPGKLKKAELIRTIQLSENNNACYATGQSEVCGQSECLWREDCA